MSCEPRIPPKGTIVPGKKPHPGLPCKLFGRPLSRPPEARGSRPLLWSAAVAASAGQALMSAVWTGQLSSVETRHMSALEAGQMSAAETRQMCSIKTGQSPVAIVDICFVSAAVLFQQQTSVLSQQQTSVLSQQQTSVLSQQRTSVLSQQQTSKPRLRRPRQRPTKVVTANPWLAEAAIAADQKVYMVPWMTQVRQPNKIDTAI